MKRLCLCLLLSGCATEGSKFPELEPSLVADTSLDCNGVDEHIVKADVLREAILTESQNAMAVDTIGAISDVAIEPITGAIFGLGRIYSANRREEGFQRAVMAAEARIRALLELHEAKACPVTASYGKGSLAPLEVLAALRELDADRTAGRLDAEAASRKQSDLISSLR